MRTLDWKVAQGRWHAVRGPSGSGKSPLLHLLGGLDRPTRGQVLLARRHIPEDAGPRDPLIDLHAMDDEALARLRRTEVGFVFQSFHLLPTLNATENAALPLLLDGVRESDARQRAEHLLETVGLGHRRGHFPEELSGGERQRVATARALAPGPSLLLADEPTGNLDRVQGLEVLELFSRLMADHDMTIVMVTHDALAAERAEQVHELDDGRWLPR